MLGGLAPDRRLDVTSSLAVVMVGLSASVLSIGRPALSLVVILAAAGLALVAVRPVMCAVLAVPAVYAIRGAGTGPVGPSDLLLAAGALLALPALARTPALRGVRPLLLAFGLYLTLLVPSLVSHPTPAAGQEVVHRLVIVLGAVLVGAWLVLEERVTPALRLLVLVSAVFAVVSVFTWLTNGHQPAYPLGFHKNYMGTLLALVLVLVLCLGPRVGLPGWLRLVAAGLLVLGVLACQSRGAILGAACGGLIWLFAPQQQNRVSGRARLAAAVLAVGFGLYAAQSVQEQLTSGDVETNSVGVRREVEAFTLDLWRSSPVYGVGLRYTTSGEYGRLAQPSNNAINNELAEAGVAGATGFLIFHLVVLRLLWQRRRTALGVSALALLSGQLLHGMFDIYWSSGITPVPFLLAGMALAAPHEKRSGLGAAPIEATSPR